MKKNVCRVMGILLLGVMLSGCNVDVPDLTEEESALITEYATNLIVKHSELSDRNLLSTTELEIGIQQEAEARELKIKADEIADAYLNKDIAMIEGADSESVDGESGSSSQSAAAPSYTISEFFEQSDFWVEYSSYELCDSYPDDEGVFMAMDATPGHQLCVVKFQVQNVSASEQEFDMSSKKGRFTLLTGDGEKLSAQSTMLLNDLSSYRGTIAANAAEEMVLIFEVEEGISQMGSMQLIMKNGSGDNTIVLE